MADAERCREGDWVEVRAVLLEPAERAAGLPPETAAQQLVVWVKGFARASASLGEGVEVATMTGRVVAGELSAVNPGYTHTFGPPAPELVGVGRDLRTRLCEYRGTTPPVPPDTLELVPTDEAPGGDAWW